MVFTIRFDSIKEPKYFELIYKQEKIADGKCNSNKPNWKCKSNKLKTYRIDFNPFIASAKLVAQLSKTGNL